jgi:hypothetical protein
MQVSKLLKVINGKGATFCAVKGYESKSTVGEVANYTIISGYSYENANEHDLAILKAANIDTLASKLNADKGMVQGAVDSLIKSIEAPNKKMSQAQQDTYIHLGAGIKEYAGDKPELQGNIYVTGLVVRKKVLVKGVRKVVNSKPETIVKKQVSKALALRKDNIRQFILNRGEYALRGVRLTK